MQYRYNAEKAQFIYIILFVIYAVFIQPLLLIDIVEYKKQFENLNSAICLIFVGIIMVNYGVIHCLKRESYESSWDFDYLIRSIINDAEKITYTNNLSAGKVVYNFSTLKKELTNPNLHLRISEYFLADSIILWAQNILVLYEHADRFFLEEEKYFKYNLWRDIFQEDHKIAIYYFYYKNNNKFFPFMKGYEIAKRSGLFIDAEIFFNEIHSDVWKSKRQYLNMINND